MEVTHIRSWNDFDAVARELDGWAFRGQRSSQWPLYSSLSRHLLHYVPDRTCWPERESRAIRIFRRKAHNYISDLRILEDDLRCLALMQHHGAPTRLVDLTKSPYVAAFFALEYATTEAAIIAFNTPVFLQATPAGNDSLTHDVVDPRIDGNFEKYFVQNAYEMVWTGEPQAMDRRLIAQSGTFLIPGVLDRSIEEILASYHCGEPLIRKIILPARDIRDEFMHSLYRMNITNASLFPDLDGLAKSVAFELEIVWKGMAGVVDGVK